MRTTLNINQIVDEWYANIDVLKVSKDSYRKKLGYWWRWLSTQEVNLRSPARSNVIDYKVHLQSLQRRESTVDSYLKAVKSFYSFCEEQRYCDNIAAGIKMSRRNYRHAKRALTHTEIDSLIGSIKTNTEKGLRDKIIVSLMICNGLRSVEVERLTVADWLPSRILLVTRKGRRDKQELRIGAEIHLMIEEYMSCRSRADDGDPLLINHSYNHGGNGISRQTISKMIKEYLRRVGIDSDKVTCHSLRHTYAQMLLDDEVPIEEIQLLLGHTNITTTKIYLGDAQHQKIMRNSPSVRLSERLLKSPKSGYN